MSIPSVVTDLPAKMQYILVNVIRQKFNSYIAFTSPPPSILRSKPINAGQAGYIYPNESMISDLMVFCSLFIEVYETFGDFQINLAQFIKADTFLHSQVIRIVEGESSRVQDGSFWSFKKDPTAPIPLPQAVEDDLNQVLRTLRNGFAHMHWHHENLSALEYWKTMNWDTANPIQAFNLHNRPKKNYMTYIVDAKSQSWKSQPFWAMDVLRIIVTHSHVLRYHLHLLLNYLLNGNTIDIFGLPA